MATKLDNLQTPGGRLVMGSLTKKGEKDINDVIIPPEKRMYFFGLAVPKTTPGLMEQINALWTMAATDYAQVPLVMNQINMGLAAPDFSWKIQDGDVVTYDDKGQPRAIPDYLKGCFIFKFSTMFEIGACDFNGVDINRADIKIGDYADVVFNSSVNGKMDKTAGIYLNPVAIRRLGYGEAIGGGAPASAVFSGRAAVMPVGATQMPTAAGATPMAGMPGAGNVGAPVQPQMGHAGMPGSMPGSVQPAMGQTASLGNVQPHTAILQGPVAGGGMPGMGR